MSVMYVTDLPYDFEGFLDDAMYARKLLSDFEDEFLDEMDDMYDRYGDDMVVTEQQMLRLDRIREKIY